MSTPFKHVDQIVDDYLHDLLGPEEADHVEKHCRECSACGRALEKAQRRLGLLHNVPAVEPSAGLVETTVTGIDEHQSRRSSLRKRLSIGVLTGLAASILILFAAQYYYVNLKPTTLDLIVLGQRELLSATTAALRIRLVDRNKGVALAGVPVVVSLRGPDGKPQELTRFTTDKQGSGNPRFEVPDWADGNYQLEINAGKETIRRPVTLKRSWKLMLSTDKPVYQPGQKIFLRALALRRPDLKPIADRQAIFTLTDPRGNVLFKHTQPTSAFGISSGECELAQEIQEGTYTIAVKVEGTESKQTVEIKRYVLPKFKLGVTTNRPYYVAGERAQLTFRADYFFGKPVAGGQLDFTITALTGQKVITKEDVRLDDKGTHRFEFTLPKLLTGRENDQGDARLLIAMSITDSAGQKQTGTGEMLVTSKPVRIEVIPEAGQLVHGLANTVHLLVRRADGEPVRGVRIQVKSTEVNTEVKTDQRGVALFQITPQMTEVSWNMRVLDASGGLLAERDDRLQVGVIQGDFLVRLDRAVCKAGQSLTITALGGGVEPLFLDLVKDKQTMLSQMIEMTNGKGELTVDIPTDLFGTVELIAYRFDGTTGLPIRKGRALYITPPAGLRIQATFDEKEYRPGREATIHFRLFDDKGKPTPGAISLAAVDEAVFAVLTQRPGSEQAFYNLEQELLKPIYAIYPWQPEEGPQVAERDRALFARTARRLDTPAPGNIRTARTQQIPEVGPHSLAARTLPQKEVDTAQLRAQRLRLIRHGWLSVIVAAILFAYLGLWMWLPSDLVLRIHAFGLGALLLLGLIAFALLATFAPKSFQSFDAVGAKMAASDRSDRMLAPGSAAVPEMMFRKRSERSEVQAGSQEPAEPRVRRDFPETMLWKPELITDEEGRLQPLKVRLADSITTWRLSASAVAADGRLGSTQYPVKVFQSFFVDLNLPVSLTRGDEVSLPVVVYNYLDCPQTVTLTLTEAAWFTLSGQAVQKIELAAGEVRSTRYTIKVSQVGNHPLLVKAVAGEVGDAIERLIDVVPDGRRVETAFNGTLGNPAEHTLDVPGNAIEGSVKAFVKIYPSNLSQLIEGLDNIFRMPYGCFEQTSSTTYPNVLALDYLRRNKLNSPALEAKARQYIHLGYQRLVGFEVQGGGFDWYGRPPANVTLTAYGLMEFTDMARVHDVDPNLLRRTRDWLLKQRQADGSWSFNVRGSHLAGLGAQDTAQLAATAYVAWAVFADDQSSTEARQTLDWLMRRRPGDIKDPHTLALVCNALVAIDAKHQGVSAYLDELARRGKRSDDGMLVYWEKDAGQRTLFHGGGLAGQVETTALTTLALLPSQKYPDETRGALAYLMARKDPNGTWYSTQATVLALKAILAGTTQVPVDKERRIELRLGKHVEEIVIPKDQGEVMKLVDVSKHLAVGLNRLNLVEKSSMKPGYQVVFRYHVPEEKVPTKDEPLAITLDYDRTELSVGGTVKVKASIINRQRMTAPMVMLDLPIPPGFAAETDDFTALVTKGTIARFQVLPRSVLVYLRGLEPDQKLELSYGLRATMPVRVAAPGGRVYEYYDPQKQGRSPTRSFVVRPGE